MQYYVAHTTTTFILETSPILRKITHILIQDYAYLFNTIAFVLAVKDFISLSASNVQQGGSRETYTCNFDLNDQLKPFVLTTKCLRETYWHSSSHSNTCIICFKWRIQQYYFITWINYCENKTQISDNFLENH